MIQLNRSMMERYEIADSRPETLRAALFGANRLMLGAVARLLDDAGIGAICITPAAEALRAQDGMFTLLVRGETEDGTPIRQERVVQSILRAVHPETEFDGMLAAAAEPQLDMAFISGANAVECALLARFLYARWQAKQAAPLVVAVEEFAAPEAAGALRAAVLALAHSWDAAGDFAAWLEGASFRCMLAECLCGGLNEAETAHARHEMNYKDEFIAWAGPQLVCTLEGEAPAQLQAVLSGVDFALACERHTRVFAALLFLCAPAGFLMGKKNYAEVMQDEALRAFVGGAFFDEILPSLPWSRAEIAPYVISCFNRLQNPMNDVPLLDLGRNLLRDFPRTVLPAIRAWADREFEAPPKLSLAFAAAIMLYAGARSDENGDYVVLRGDERLFLRDNRDVMEAFARLAHDVPAETLAYAALADRALWGEDLREIDGLEQRIATDLSTIQRVGFGVTLG